jgi:uncharacterized protein YoxC
MSAADWLAATGTVLLAILFGALLAALWSVMRTLRTLRGTVDDLRTTTLELVEEMRDRVRDAQFEIDRVDALVTTAEGVGERVDSASRLVSRTVTNPVVKALALGSGTRRAVRRLRGAPGGVRTRAPAGNHRNGKSTGNGNTNGNGNMNGNGKSTGNGNGAHR